MQLLDDFVRSFNEAGFALEHLTYLLLVLSMAMRRIVWLRVIAIASSAVQITHAILFEYDPVVIFWDSMLAMVNLGQLALMAWENRRRNWSDETRRFVASFTPQLAEAAAARLMQAGFWHEGPAGAMLTVEGQPVKGLLYISAGTVRIEAGGKAVATCGAGDFLGEMTWQSGKPATGTAIAEGTVRYLRFERSKLEAALKARPELRFALQTSFNRNLIEKLVRANQTAATQAAIQGANA